MTCWNTFSSTFHLCCEEGIIVFKSPHESLRLLLVPGKENPDPVFPCAMLDCRFIWDILCGIFDHNHTVKLLPDFSSNAHICAGDPEQTSTAKVLPGYSSMNAISTQCPVYFWWMHNDMGCSNKSSGVSQSPSSSFFLFHWLMALGDILFPLGSV